MSEGQVDVLAAMRRIAAKITGLEYQVSEMARLDAVKIAFDLIQSQFDGFTKEILASRSQRTLQDKSFKDLNEMVTKQELRLTNLEKFGGKS